MRCLRIPLTIVGIPTAAYQAGDIEARDAAGPLALTQEDEPARPEGVYRRYKVPRATEGDVAILYVGAAARGRARPPTTGRCSTCAPRPAASMSAGISFLACRPREGPYRLTLDWDLAVDAGRIARDLVLGRGQGRDGRSGAAGRFLLLCGRTAAPLSGAARPVRHLLAGRSALCDGRSRRSDFRLYRPWPNSSTIGIRPIAFSSASIPIAARAAPGPLDHSCSATTRRVARPWMRCRSCSRTKSPTTGRPCRASMATPPGTARARPNIIPWSSPIAPGCSIAKACCARSTSAPAITTPIRSAR